MSANADLISAICRCLQISADELHVPVIQCYVGKCMCMLSLSSCFMTEFVTINVSKLNAVLI